MGDNNPEVVSLSRGVSNKCGYETFPHVVRFSVIMIVPVRGMIHSFGMKRIHWMAKLIFSKRFGDGSCSKMAHLEGKYFRPAKNNVKLYIPGDPPSKMSLHPSKTNIEPKD